jgi:hypothetical protein
MNEMFSIFAHLLDGGWWVTRGSRPADACLVGLVAYGGRLVPLGRSSLRCTLQWHA